jgi:hypothetical protein
MKVIVGVLKVAPKLAYNKRLKKWMNIIIMHNQKKQKCEAHMHKTNKSTMLLKRKK